MKWSVPGIVIGVVLMATNAAATCAYISRLAEDAAEASALRQAIEQVRPIPEDPLAYKPQGVDEFSLTCLACHAGNLLTGWNVRLVHGGQDAAGSHRIGTNYVFLSLRGQALQEPESLDSRIVLVHGRVGCLSCHDPFNPVDKHLVMTNSGSRLCLSCHRK